MTTTLRRIDPVSLAKIYAAIYGILALLAALPMGCAMSMMGAALGDGGGGFGLVAIITYPIVGVIAGFIGGWISAFVYNLVADRMGGVELEFDDMDATMDIL